MYVSDVLATRFPHFHETFTSESNRHGISLQTLTGTNDIWCRDYMPAKNGKGGWVGFDYSPDYLKNKQNGAVTNYRLLEAVKYEQINHMDLVVDGGNIEVGPNGVVMLCDKVFKENSKLTENEIINRIAHHFETDNIIVLPTDPDDVVGHVDGMARFIEQNHVVLNDYGDPNSRFTTEIRKRIESHGFSVTLLPCYRNRPMTKWDATGCYVNFVIARGVMFFPVFGDRFDAEAVSIIESIFKGPIVPIICREIAIEGGALNCVTWGN